MVTVIASVWHLICRCMFNDEVGHNIASGAFERTSGTLEQYHELEIQMIDDIHILL